MGPKFSNSLTVNLLPSLHITLRVLGLLPESRAELCYSVFVSFFMLFNSLPIMVDLYLHRDDLIHLITNFGVAIVFFGAFLGHSLVLLRSTHLQSVIKKAEVDFDESITSRESAVRYLRKNHILLLVITIMVWITMIAYISEPLVNQRAELIVPGWYPFSTEGTVMFTLTYIYQAFSVCFAGFAIHVITLVFCELSLHMSVHLENLSLSIQETVSSENYTSDVDMEEEMNKRLAQCVKRHIALLSQINEMGKSFETAGLIDYVATIVATATVALQTVIMVENVSLLQQGKSVALLLATALEIYPPCFIAESVIEMHAKIADSTFSHHVVTTPESVKKTLHIINIKSQAPIAVVNFLGLIDVDLITYSDALKMAYAVFTILHHFKGN